MSQDIELSSEELSAISSRDSLWQPRCQAIVPPYADYCDAGQGKHKQPDYESPEFDLGDHRIKLIDHPFVYPSESPEADRRRLLEHLRALTA